MADRRAARERAIFLAMAALYDVANKSAAAPINPSLGFRALLAFLYLHSNRDKSSFVGSWRECQNEWEGHHQPGYCRSTYTLTQWHGIAAATGFDRMQSFGAESEILAKEDKKRKRDCGWL